MRFSFIILALLFPNISIADTLKVIAGNHDNFVRIVVLSNERRMLEVEISSNKFILEFGEKDTKFNLLGVYEKIDNNRVNRISDLGGGRLEIEISCLCHAKKFEVDGGIVVDIIDGVKEDVGEAKFAFDPNPETILHQIFDSIELTESRGLVSNWIGRMKPKRSDLLQSLGGSTPNFDYSNQNESGGALEDNRGGLNLSSTGARNDLYTQVGIAATRGIVSIDTLERRSSELDSLSTTENEISDVEVTSQFRNGEVLEHLKIDRVDNVEENLQRNMSVPGRCSQFEKKYDLGYLNKKTTFGLEALEILKLTNFLSPEKKEVYKSIANIIEYGSSLGSAVFREFSLCDSHLALWAILSDLTSENPLEFSVDSIKLSFSELPLHLRRHLGPKLSQRFLKLGNLAVAEEILQSIDRASGVHGSEFEMTRIELHLSETDPMLARSQLEDVFRADGPFAPASVVRLVDLSFENEIEIPAGFESAVAALAFEARGTSDEEPLMKAMLQIAMRKEEPIKILRAIEKANLDGVIGDSSRNILQNQLLNMKIAKIGDDDFVELLFQESLDVSSLELAPETLGYIATRLMEIGLNEQSRGFLELNPTFKNSVDLKKLFLRNFITEGQLDQAEELLMVLEGEDFEFLRAEVLELKGRLEEAAEIHGTLDNEQTFETLLKRSGDWAALSESDEPEWGKIADFATSSPQLEDFTSSNSLRSAEQLLNLSKKTRESLQAVISF